MDASAYQLRIGATITQLPGTRPAGPAVTHLPATFVTGLPFHPGIDVSGLPALAATLRNPTSVFAGTATPVETVAGQRGFFVVQGAHFGQGEGSSGFLVVFVPASWLSSSLSGDPSGAAVDLNGNRLTGTLDAKPAADDGFNALTQHWLVDVAPVPPTGLQSALPPLAFAWPLATVLVVLLVGRGMRRRRRAEREIDDVYDLSLDLLCILGVDGYLKRVNPAFENTLGYEAAELLSLSLLEFTHPLDRETIKAALARLQAGEGSERFESRYVRSDGGVRWLEWSACTDPWEGSDLCRCARCHRWTNAPGRAGGIAADGSWQPLTRRAVESSAYLHDGAQHRLVQTILTLKRARLSVDAGSEDVAELIEKAVASAESANDELRDLARGIHPVILATDGLAPALRGIARRSPIPVALDLQMHGRLPERVEVTAYYVVSEALTNAAKHSNATAVHIAVTVTDSEVRVSIGDDGVGGADLGNGSGLLGLNDRVEAAGGKLTVASPPGQGTHLTVELPLTAP